MFLHSDIIDIQIFISKIIAAHFLVISHKAKLLLNILEHFYCSYFKKNILYGLDNYFVPILIPLRSSKSMLNYLSMIILNWFNYIYNYTFILSMFYFTLLKFIFLFKFNFQPTIDTIHGSKLKICVYNLEEFISIKTSFLRHVELNNHL